MKYVKLFEQFFSFFVNDKLSDNDIIKLYGITRYDIEDMLLSINDTGKVNTSINFKLSTQYGSGFYKSDEYKFENGQMISNLWNDKGDPLKIGETPYTSEIKSVDIEIHIYLNEYTNNISDDDISELKSNLRNDIISFQKKMESFGFEVEFDKLNHRKSNRQLNLHTHEDVYYGGILYSIFCEKQIN